MCDGATSRSYLVVIMQRTFNLTSQVQSCMVRLLDNKIVHPSVSIKWQPLVDGGLPLKTVEVKRAAVRWPGRHVNNAAGNASYLALVSCGLHGCLTADKAPEKTWDYLYSLRSPRACSMSIMHARTANAECCAKHESPMAGESNVGACTSPP